MGDVDLYWNNRLVSYTQNQKSEYIYTKINVNFTSILLERTSKKLKDGSEWKIGQSWDDLREKTTIQYQVILPIE